jgi:uncharacterized GH25 family protein
MKAIRLAAALAFALAVWPAAAGAHDFWLSEVEAVAGRPPTITLGYGHNFPVGEDIPEENLSTRFQGFSIEGPGGRSGLSRGAEAKLLVGGKPLEEGIYVVWGDATPLFLTQTTEGWSIRAKDEAENPLASNLSAKHAKTVIRVGAGGGDLWSRPVGQKLEIVPLADPTSLAAGARLPVRILFRGLPLASAKVDAFAEGAGTAAASAVTGADGAAEIPLDRAGWWRLMVEHSIPYEGDRSKADNELNIASLALKVGP